MTAGLRWPPEMAAGRRDHDGNGQSVGEGDAEESGIGLDGAMPTKMRANVPMASAMHADSLFIVGLLRLFPN